MKTFRGKIDENDLEYVMRIRKKTPIAVVPCPFVRGRIHPNTTAFLFGDGTITQVFHVKPIYYEALDETWRPISEIATHFGHKKITLRNDWDEFIHPSFLRWWIRRMELIGGEIKIPSPFGQFVPIREGREIFFTACSSTSGVACYPDPHIETTSVDGYVIRNNLAGCVSFSTLRADNGNNSDDSDTQFVSFLGNNYGSPDCTNPSWNGMSRSIFLFDTSIPETNTINSATASFYGTSSENMYSQTADLVQSTVASNTALANSDYQGTVNDTTLQSDTQIGLGSWSTTAYNDYPLNATGIGNIDKMGVTKLGVRLSADRTNSAPSWSSGRSSVYGYTAEQTNTDKDPKLVVTHTAAAVAGMSLLTLMGVG